MIKLFYFRHNKTNAPPIEQLRLTFYELTFVFKGSLHYIINYNAVEVKKGEAIFIKKNSLRERKNGHGENSSDYVSFNFYADENDEIEDLPMLIKNCFTSDILLLLSACDEIYGKMLGLDVEKSLQLILMCLLRQLSSNLKIRTYSPLTLQIMQYTRQNLNRHLSLEEIGKATNFSVSYCCSVFKKETGKSIVNYILDEKINEAKRLLIDNVPLNAVSEQLGFNDYNYFSRIFKQKVHYSPLQYKTTFFNETKKNRPSALLQ